MMLSAPNIFICLLSMAGIDKGKNFIKMEKNWITKEIYFFMFLAAKE